MLHILLSLLYGINIYNSQITMNKKGKDLLIGNQFKLPGDSNEYIFEGSFTSASKADLIIYSFFNKGKREFKVSRSNIEIIITQ